MIGGYSSSRVFFMDCRSHTWHESPSMQVVQNPLVSVLDGKIYVVEGRTDCNPSNFMEFFDPKTQLWEHAPNPAQRYEGEHIYTSFAKEGNLYVIEDKDMVYKPKENRWDAVGLRVSDSSPMIDNESYCYYASGWSWRALKGLKDLPKLPKGYNRVRLVKYGRSMAVLWEENISAIGSTKKKKMKKIWCAEIETERHNAQEIFGKVKWCDVVLTVPKSYRFEQVIVATV